MFYEKVINYCKEKKLSISAFEKKCNIGNGTIGKWAKENSRPSLQTLEKIAIATNIPISKWMDNENESNRC